MVQRTINANELVYQANLTADGLHPQVPLNVFWVMKTRGGAREELTNMERSKAYGLRFLSIQPHEVRFTVKALEGVPFRAVATGGSGDEGLRVVAYANVDGDEMAVEHVFIATKGGGLIPKVLYIEFTGTSPSTHEPVVHRYFPKGSHPDPRVAAAR